MTDTPSAERCANCDAEIEKDGEEWIHADGYRMCKPQPPMLVATPKREGHLMTVPDGGTPAEAIVIADERDHMQAAMHLMRDVFVDACQSGVAWEKAHELQGQFFDGYATAKRIWGTALMKRDVLDKDQTPLDTPDPTPAEAIDAARKAFERVMDTWNGRIRTVGAKLEIAWQSAAYDAGRAAGAAAQREADIKLARDYRVMVCLRRNDDGTVYYLHRKDFYPFADVLAAAPEERP